MVGLKSMLSGTSLFGGVPDVLFQIINASDVSTLPALCVLNQTTYQTIKANEMLICTLFLRHHGIATLDPILMLDPTTGHPGSLTIRNLQKFITRQETAGKLAARVARSGWGAWWAIKDAGIDKMDDEADLFRQRVERGVYVVFQMTDIVTRGERRKHQRPGRFALAVRAVRCSLMPRRPSRACRSRETSYLCYARDITHNYAVLSRELCQEEIGKMLLAFRRKHLDEEREVDFHIALQMLRLLLEMVIFAHGPDDGTTTPCDDSIMWWFLLRQPASSLAHLFLDLPDTKCCSVEDRARRDIIVCNYSGALKEYWSAWLGDPDLDCKNCEAWLRSRSVKPVLNDEGGETYDRYARDWIRQMRGQGEFLLRG